MFFKMVLKKLFSLQNLMKKVFETHYSLEKNCLQVTKMVTPPPPPPPRYKYNGPCLNLTLEKSYHSVITFLHA